MRITGGIVSGIEFFSPKGTARPILERSRISLFSSLGPFDGLKVIDIFAGSGAFGLEAASRGASEVIFVEKSQIAVNVI
ncbi:MAG TPA: RsmD family RNA methyltransferase, partial [Victivallales bacterium]|nr:RsmD family RNA methyltransferase [Victivallales bacterium]